MVHYINKLGLYYIVNRQLLKKNKSLDNYVKEARQSENKSELIGTVCISIVKPSKNKKVSKDPENKKRNLKASQI